ncbi:MAG: rRNA maturation RNase YbeY [Oscillospiraceae bacterium]|nr:rRNA maturation RNase YbeY [Oscillospiraceae bacterium]
MKNIKINITFDKFSFSNIAIKNIIKTCIHATMRQQGVNVPCEINVLVTDDAVIRGINKSTREIDKATDVLSFPMFQFEPGILPEDWSLYLDPGTGRCPLGDMAISLERAVAQAKEFGHSTKREVGYLTIHSMLHLLGYDHLDEGEQKAQMRAEEEKIVSEIPGMQR